MIGPQQAFVCYAVQHHRKFPCEVFAILNAGIGATRTEGRDLMGRIANEDHAAVQEAVDAPTLERIQRHPFKLELVVLEHLPDARDDLLGRCSSSALASGPSCRSIRQTSPGCLWSSAECP